MGGSDGCATAATAARRAAEDLLHDGEQRVHFPIRADGDA
jgi:hypothetical protein